MYIKIIVSAICLPICMSLLFSLIQQAKTTTEHRSSDDNFTIKLSPVMFVVGVLGVITATAVMLGFTFLSNEKPHYIFYIVFGSFFLLGAYLAIRTLTFKVVVKGDQITVYSALKKPYTFTFSEIVSAVRHVKPNQIKTESIVIKTANGKKLTVGSVEEEYERFSKRIRAEVSKQYLVGFKKY
ncbi:MAG: hypothetical protein IKM34_07910 [Clostridia bacterium]|nr:hypothetical protein [Clostridia bacterium]